MPNVMHVRMTTAATERSFIAKPPPMDCERRGCVRSDLPVNPICPATSCSRGSGPDPEDFGGAQHRRRALLHAELLVEAKQARLDRAGAHREALRDLLV